MSLNTPIRTDRRPTLAVCAYHPDDADWDEGGQSEATGFGAGGVRSLLVEPDAPDRLVETLRERLLAGDCRGLLLVGRGTQTDRFRIQMRASNRSLEGAGKLPGTGPSIARTTAPVADMVRELKDAGLVAEAFSDSEHDVGSYLLYALLTGMPDDMPTPAIGLLRAPVNASRRDMARGVRIAANAMAQGFSPIRRSGLEAG